MDAIAGCSSLHSKSDDEIVRGLDATVRVDNRNGAVMLRYIAECDERQLWARKGHSSMFRFLVVRWHMSDPVAGLRIYAARTARRFPVIFDMLERGELHMTAISQLSAHLTPDNHAAVLEEAKHKTKNEIAELIARISPRLDVPSTVRKLPRRKKPAARSSTPSPESAPPSPTEESSSPADDEPARQEEAQSSFALASLAEPRSPDPEPLAEARYRLQVTLGQKGRDNLQTLADLLAHQIPNGDPAHIVELALETLLEKVTKQRTAATKSPRRPRSTDTNRDRRSRHVPSHIRRAVWERDEGRCSFVGDDGRRCGETRALEIGHLSPWGKGGEHTVDNCALRCPGHNHYEAVRDYGAELIASKIRGDHDQVREALSHYRRVAPCAVIRTPPAPTSSGQCAAIVRDARSNSKPPTVNGDSGARVLDQLGRARGILHGGSNPRQAIGVTTRIPLGVVGMR